MAFPLWINILIAITTFFFMEGVAWFTHKYIMHGFLWSWHKSHHAPYEGIFERNDLFAIVFSLPAILCIVIGLEVEGLGILFWIGIGITGYGIFYVLFHDIIVHRRIKIPYKATTRYMKRLIRAHKIHHTCSQKEGAEAFGFLYAPKKYQPK
jgi:beta-carotene 3-hydroxylase